MNEQRYVMCVRNEGYPASLALRKVYEALPDGDAESEGLLRVIDESGEDYLFPREMFVPVEVPASARVVFAGARSPA